MNDIKRKRLDEAIELLTNAKEIIDEVSSEERGAFDNMPDSLQSADIGEKLEGNADTLDEALSEIDEIIANIQTTTE
jgi:hypothetical protein